MSSCDYNKIASDLHFFSLVPTVGAFLLIVMMLVLGFGTVSYYGYGAVDYNSNIFALLLIVSFTLPAAIYIGVYKWFEWRTRGYRLVRYCLERSDFSVVALLFSQSAAVRGPVNPGDSLVVAFNLPAFYDYRGNESRISSKPIIRARVENVAVDGCLYVAQIFAKCYILDATGVMVKNLLDGVPLGQWQLQHLSVCNRQLEDIATPMLSSAPLTKGVIKVLTDKLAQEFGRVVYETPDCPMYLCRLSMKLSPVSTQADIESSFDREVPDSIRLTATITTVLDEFSGPSAYRV